MGSNYYKVNCVDDKVTINDFINIVSNDTKFEWGLITVYKFDEYAGQFLCLTNLRWEHYRGIVDCDYSIDLEDFSSEIYTKDINCSEYYGNADFIVKLKRKN